MQLNKSILQLKTAETAERICESIKQQVQIRSAEGVVLGLSGGIDSAVLVTLAARAIGPENVHPYFLYDRDTDRGEKSCARLIADWTGTEFNEVSIEDRMKREGIYEPFIMKIGYLSGGINRLLNYIYSVFYGENPFITTLYEPDFSSQPVKKFFYEHTVKPVEKAFNARHIYRRKFIEHIAAERNLLPAGSANRSELLTGWYVKGGIDDLEFSPLIGCCKTRIYSLADFLEIPPEIRRRKASPGMMKGINDEFALGIDYTTLDLILYGIENGFSNEQIAGSGIKRQTVMKIRRLFELAKNKRESIS